MTQPTLYFLMRSDIADMNPGKGMAQSGHIQADFDAVVAEVIDENTIGDEELINNILEWKGDRNFGRTITKLATLDEMKELFGLLCEIENFRCAVDDETLTLRGFTTDGSYPYKNYYGKLFVKPTITGAFVFVSSSSENEPKWDEFKRKLRSVEMHP
jgi:hypothetical protein